MKKKICTKCREEKSVSEFAKDKSRKDECYPQCKKCKRKKYKEYSQQLGVKKRRCRYMKKYDAERKLEVKEKNLINKYGMTLKEWNKVFQKQKGKCAICSIHQSELHWGLCVDHNHKTGYIRGLLCHKCNDGIGRLRADEGTYILKQAINYIKKNK